MGGHVEAPCVDIDIVRLFLTIFIANYLFLIVIKDNDNCLYLYVTFFQLSHLLGENIHNTAFFAGKFSIWWCLLWSKINFTI